MKINISVTNLLKGKQTTEKKGKDLNWPTDPVRPGDDPEYILDVAFYDGTTKPDQEDPTGYSTVEYRKQFFGEPYNFTKPVGFLGPAYNFYQGPHTVRAEDILSDWDASISNRDYAIFDRRPMEKIQYSDFIANREVLPVGVSRPDFEITLKYPENGGEAVKVNHLKIFRNGVYGATADVINDDTSTTGYRIWSPPLTTGHLKLEEKTFTAVFVHIGAAYGALEWKTTPLVKSEKVSEVDNIAWIPFDTSDNINFKMTREPSYEAEEYREPPLKMTSQYSKLRVFTIPRKWWVYLYNHEGMEVLDPIHCWGVWIHPPKDFAMPVPRKQGAFELGHPWDAVEFYSETPIDDMEITDIVYSEVNAHAVFNFNGVDAEGDHDSDERNSIYTLYAFDSAVTVQYSFGQLNDFRHAVYLPGGEFEDFNSMWACWYLTTDVVGGHLSPSPTSGFIKTMPDMKEPLAVGERAFHPWKGIAHGGNPADDKVDYTRKLKAYTEASGAFQTDGIEAKNKIWTAARSAIIDSTIGTPPTSVTSWGIGAAGAKEKDLVAVLESGDGNPIFVWRKTDEVYVPETDFYYQAGAVYYMSNPENFIFSGRADDYELWNVTGVIEWPLPGTYSESQGFAFNRKVSHWGTYCTFERGEIGHDETGDYYTYYATPVRSTIELDAPVLMLACFSIFPNAYARQLWTE